MMCHDRRPKCKGISHRVIIAIIVLVATQSPLAVIVAQTESPSLQMCPRMRPCPSYVFTGHASFPREAANLCPMDVCSHPLQQLAFQAKGTILAEGA